MKGIELCEKYYKEYGNELIARHIGYEGQICAGVCGRGSEFFGYDDDISSDHDFYAGFYLWLTEEQDREIGFELMREYSKLPASFMGVKIMASNPGASKHFGVTTIGDFFFKMVGKSQKFSTWEDWFYTPSEALACATNGKIFEKGNGEFIDHRNNLLSMPKDVKLKKMAGHLALMAQTGQYNFERCISHGERGAACLCKNQFAVHTAKLCHLLQNRYAPFYKWLLRSLGDEFLDNIKGDLTELLTSNDEKRESFLIEKISDKIHQYLLKEGFVTTREDYLENCAFEISSQIETRAIRILHMMDVGE